jgi:hypothetical protein
MNCVLPCIIHLNCEYYVHIDNLLITADCDSDKWQTRPLVRDGATRKQNRICLTITKIWSWAPDGFRYQGGRTDWPPVTMELRRGLRFYLEIEAAGSFETLVPFYQTKWRLILEDYNLNQWLVFMKFWVRISSRRQVILTEYLVVYQSSRNGNTNEAMIAPSHV